MAFDFATAATFFTTKVLPAIQSILAAGPGLLSGNLADVQAALAAILKVITDLQTDVTTLVAAVKASQPAA